MTTQEKSAAIKKIIANDQDNLTAVAAANVQAGLSDLVVEAMNEAFKSDLEKQVFAG